MCARGFFISDINSDITKLSKDLLCSINLNIILTSRIETNFYYNENSFDDLRGLLIALPTNSATYNPSVIHNPPYIRGCALLKI